MRSNKKADWENSKQKKENAVIENVFYIAGWLFLAVAGVLFLVWKFNGFTIGAYLPPCVFHAMTGLYCPGCGGTRAVYALLRGEVGMSLFYYPFVFYAAVLGTWFMVSQTIERISRHTLPIGLRFRPVYLWIALILILANFFVKNIALIVFHVKLM
ncbi:MAG: DUF2752 domain-containing protein [Lachnospiraceae bacterium]|nr:DUF2752 domain-containing protein [Lachnospiraceae bacterium]